MENGYLSQYFEGVAVKTLSAVESDTLSSNQHEFNGVKELKNILGEPEGKERYEANFLYFSDETEAPVMEEGFLTWYDARQKARDEKGVMRWEYRLYFPSNMASELASENDLLLIAKKKDGSLLAIIADSESTISSQILWLFGIKDTSLGKFTICEEAGLAKAQIEFASRTILENIGIDVELSDDYWLDKILAKFGEKFPTTKVFSAFARATLPDVNANDGHDGALMAWMEREEVLFRTFEKYIVGGRLSQGFDGDVDGFISFSLSVHNRRKSRAGLALENHLEILFKECNIRHTRTPTTENKAKPDFIFPGIDEYKNETYNALDLTMLGVKSTCKDRWRQVLSEADRVEHKHLLTLESAISKNQTDEMNAKKLQLVVPLSIQETYTADQRKWLMGVGEFTQYVANKQ